MNGKADRAAKILTDYIRISNRTFPEYQDYEEEGNIIFHEIYV